MRPSDILIYLTYSLVYILNKTDNRYPFLSCTRYGQACSYIDHCEVDNNSLGFP